MGTKYVPEDFPLTLNSATLCASDFEISMKRSVINARTNCGNDTVAGSNAYDLKASGPLEFGSGATESTLYANMTAAAQAWTWKPDNAAVGVTNPQYSGSVAGESFTIKASVTAPVSYDFGAKGSDSAGIPTRATA